MEHSLYHEGKERGFQQLGPGLHLVAGSISRLVSGSARSSYVVDRVVLTRVVLVSATVAGKVASIKASALEASIVGLDIDSLLRGERGDASLLLLLCSLRGVESAGHGVNSKSKGLH